MRWEYTVFGCEHVEVERFGIKLQLQRLHGSLTFVGLSSRKRSLALFVGAIDHGRLWGDGIELSDNRRWCCGIIKDITRAADCHVRWSGSAASPWRTITLRLGHVFVGFKAPTWLIRRKIQQVHNAYNWSSHDAR